MSVIEALKKTVTGPIEMSIQMDDPDNGDTQNIGIDVEESPLRKTAHGDWPTMYRLPTFPPAVRQSLVRKDPRLTDRGRSGGPNTPGMCKSFVVKLNGFIIII